MTMFELSPRFLMLLLTAVVTLPTLSRAEVSRAVLNQAGLQVQCSYCEDSDRNQAACTFRIDSNYCACRTSEESAIRLLVSDRTTKRFISFHAYIKQKVRALQKRYKRQKRTKNSNKKEVSKLLKKLGTFHTHLIAQCHESLPTAFPTETPTPSSDFEKPTLDVVAEKGEYTLYILNKYTHSFAFDISEKGRIVGAFMTEEPTRDSPSSPRDYQTGLPIASYYSTRLTPFVWSEDGLARACDNCQGLLLTSLNDSNKQAVGNSSLALGNSEPVVFNYSTNSLVPLLGTNGLSAEVTSINESGLIVGATYGLDPVNSSAAVWSNGTQTILPRGKIIDTLDAQLRTLLEERIKKDLRDNQDLNECEEHDIESTELAEHPVRASIPVIRAIKVADSGDILGHVYDTPLEWSYTGTCRSGTHYERVVDFHTFIVTSEGSIQVIPGRAVQGGLMSVTRPWSTATALNNLGQVIGYGAVDTFEHMMQILTLNFRAAETEWSVKPLGGSSYFAPTTINDSGMIAGNYGRGADSQQEGRAEQRAFMLVDNTFSDLNERMGLQSDGDLILETVTAMNNCGVLVGRAYDSAKKQNRLFILAKDGCPIPS
jgi:uncharacterized membrane protein